jgi:hypothetical protein
LSLIKCLYSSHQINRWVLCHNLFVWFFSHNDPFLLEMLNTILFYFILRKLLTNTFRCDAVCIHLLRLLMDWLTRWDCLLINFHLRIWYNWLWIFLIWLRWKLIFWLEIKSQLTILYLDCNSFIKSRNHRDWIFLALISVSSWVLLIYGAAWKFIFWVNWL